MSWSKIAFGASRCVSNVPAHEASLLRALRGGLTVIDTSINYMGGRSEKLVGDVVNRWHQAGEGDKDSLVVISKFGYATVDSKAPGLVPVAAGLAHSLHPDFHREAFSTSTERLHKINSYLVEDPEHHLAHKIGLSSGTSEGSGQAGTAGEKRMNDAHDAFYEEMETLFTAMEERVGDPKEGGVSSYGVSSAGLSLSSNDPMHLSWRRLLGCAEAAARKAGKRRHSLGILQMPANLLEVAGLDCAPEMQSAGIKVMACHPLRAATAQGKFHLVDDALRGGLPADYMDVCREVLEFFTLEIPDSREPTAEEEEIRQGCRFLQQLVQDLNNQLTHFTSLDHYEAELSGSITPMISQKFEALDETSSDLLQKFFERYGKMVRYSCAQKARDMVSSGEGCVSGPHTIPDQEPLQRYAIRWVTQRPGVDCTVVGMDHEDHVDNALQILHGG